MCRFILLGHGYKRIDWLRNYPSGSGFRLVVSGTVFPIELRVCVLCTRARFLLSFLFVPLGAAPSAIHRFH